MLHRFAQALGATRYEGDDFGRPHRQKKDPITIKL